MKNPLISVIIPAHNNASTIETAITSIANQTYTNIEIIVVNDNSTDGTESIVRELMSTHKNMQIFQAPEDPERFDVKLNRNVNAGYSARNTGFKHTKGEYITFQDADDVSLLDRIEVQYDLLLKHDAVHICTDCREYDEKLVGTYTEKKDIEYFTGPQEIYELSQQSKGLIAKISNKINSSIPFHLKRLRVINRLFFGSLAPYPGAGNSPLFKKEVIEKVKFRPLKYRVWPSFMGRGADRDFNFQVAETFKNSYFFPITTYLWRTKR